MSQTKTKNPIVIGIIATICIVVFVLAYSKLYDFPTYIGWVGFVWMTAVPVQIIMGLLWHFEHPKLLASLPQPKKGVAFALLSLVPMLFGGLFLYFVPGGGVTPGPFLIMATIISIVATFWIVGAWQCWPLNRFFKTPVSVGIASFVAAHIIGYGLYMLFFNFDFLSGAPIYVEALNPHGLVNAWHAVAFSVTSVAAIMALSLFEFWPCTVLAKKQPSLGVVNTIVVLAMSALVYCVCVYSLGMDIVDYLVRVPISFIFGVFLVANMMQHQLFSRLLQPLRGFSLFVTAGVMAFLMQILYRGAIPYVVDAPIHAGPPAYEVELWIATALLSITFPVINLVSGYFGFWPFIRNK